jgi:hypothetical protein
MLPFYQLACDTVARGSWKLFFSIILEGSGLFEQQGSIIERFSVISTPGHRHWHPFSWIYISVKPVLITIEVRILFYVSETLLNA